MATIVLKNFEIEFDPKKILEWAKVHFKVLFKKNIDNVYIPAQNFLVSAVGKKMKTDLEIVIFPDSKNVDQLSVEIDLSDIGVTGKVDIFNLLTEETIERIKKHEKVKLMGK